jgi:hypothetical protein
MACFGLRTVFPLRPLFSFPCFISFISVSTYEPASLYFRRLLAFFVLALFLAVLFVAVDFFRVVRFAAFLAAV